MVDFQSRDTRRGVSDGDEAEADASDETEQDEQAEPDDSDVEEAVDESEPSGVDGHTDAESTEPSGGDEGSSELGITAADPNSAATDDPLSDEGHTSDGDSVPTDAGPSESDPAAASEPAASSDADRIDADPGTEPEDATPEPEDATPEPEDATPEPQDATSTTPSRTVGIALVTVGDSTQTSLDEALETAIESTGHDVVVRERAAGGYDGLQQVVDELVGLPAVDVVVTVGGIGISPEERAIEAIHPLLEKALPGFGEAFRNLLFERIGTGIVAVRSTAGITDGTLVFSLPADAAAARLAIEEIIATEAPELVAHLDE